MNLDKLFKHLQDEHGLLLLETEMQEIANCLPNEKALLLNYEIRGSWWPQYIRIGWMQVLAGKYFARKIDRKYNRMKRSFEMQSMVEKWKEAGL
jgi:hypothetical protein